MEQLGPKIGVMGVKNGVIGPKFGVWATDRIGHNHNDKKETPLLRPKKPDS